MGFFNPAFLWFALGGLIPVILHLLHRQKFRRVRWAAMEFLLAALKKTQRRLQLENLLLLLLRILVLVLLALAVARPFFREAPLGAFVDSDAHHIFVIDNSASMGYKRAQHTSLDVARRAAEKVLEEIRTSEQDRFSLVTLSQYPETLLKARNRKEFVKAAIQELKPSDYGTSLHATLLEIRSLLDAPEIRNRDRHVYLFTDLQRVGWESRDDAEARRFAELLKELSRRPSTWFSIYDAGTTDAHNAALVDLRLNDRVVTTKRTARFTAEIHNFSPTPRPAAGVHFYVNDSLARTEQVVLPPNATIPVEFEYDFREAAPYSVRVSLDPDYLDADDHRHAALDVKSALRGLVVDGDPGDSPKTSETYAFATALDPTRQAQYFSVDVKTPELFSAEGLEAYDFLVLANVQSLTSDKVEKIERFVRRGGGLFLTLGARVDKVSFNEAFWAGGRGLSPAALEDVVGQAPEGQLERGVERRIGRFAAGHPVFRAFQKQLMASLYGLVFYKHYTVKDFDPDKVLAALDDNFGSPLMLEKPFGDGKVLLLTSTIDEEWNAGIQAHPPFIVLSFETAQYLASRPSARRNLFVGDLLHASLPVEMYQPPFLLETPVEGVVTLPAQAPKEERFFDLFYPAKAKSDDPRVLRNEGLRHAGRYKLTRSAQRDDEKLVGWFAVNMGPRSPSREEIQRAEGNLERLTREEIQKRFPDFKVEFRGEKREGTTEMELASPPASGLWKHLLYLVVGLMLAESVLATLFGRGKQ
ncbi:MAG TPA: BatA domain-containing protein [Planctomycetota bacterium]|nr:BatA domain-containing protein [Planctomycetota bacterium]